MAIAREAGASTLPYFRSVELEVEHKHDDTPVTEADRGAERLVRMVDGRIGDDRTITDGDGHLLAEERRATVSARA